MIENATTSRGGREMGRTGRIAAIALALALAPAVGAADVPAKGPAVSLLLRDRHGHAAPDRSGCTHTGGGNVDVAQPAPDTLVITLTGVAVATAHPAGSAAVMSFDLQQ